MNMNIARNMEAIFLVTFALTCVTAYAAPLQRTADAPRAAVAKDSMTVITVTAKRLTAAQKAQLGA
jgi:hypothetical protein